MSPIYLVLGGAAILYLLSKKAEAQPPAPPAEPPLIPEEGGEVVMPDTPEEALPPGTIVWLRFPVQTSAGSVTHFTRDERSWNGRKGDGKIVIGTSFSSLDQIEADGRFQITTVTFPPGFQG